MQYGLIGEHLPHSFSREIHEALGLYRYELKELAPGEVIPFLENKEFSGINVTIPYKQTVLPCLDTVEEQAASIGAVNTIVNRNGRLIGYNTDFDGMRLLIARMGLSLEGKKALILGTGGTSKTAAAVCSFLKAKQILKVSRTKQNGAVTYQEAKEFHRDAEIIINTTPCGMFPREDQQPVDLEGFPALEGVIDAVYNPLNTELVQQARRLGRKASGGLYMLVAQAVCAARRFTASEISEDRIEEIYRKLVRQKRNLVLIGMPASGKTTVGKRLSEKTGKPLIDTDEEILRKIGMSIPEYFRLRGENAFREKETEVIRVISSRCGQVIATGGGSVLREENVRALRRNGLLIFLNRPVEQLIPTQDRPTADSVEKIRVLYRERLPVYQSAAEITIGDFSSPENTVNEIESKVDG